LQIGKAWSCARGIHENKRAKANNTYLRVASALSMVTLSSVASRLGRPRSKYLISKSKNGKISCETQQSSCKHKKKNHIIWHHGVIFPEDG